MSLLNVKLSTVTIIYELVQQVFIDFQGLIKDLFGKNNIVPHYFDTGPSGYRKLGIVYFDPSWPDNQYSAPIFSNPLTSTNRRSIIT